MPKESPCISSSLSSALAADRKHIFFVTSINATHYEMSSIQSYSGLHVASAMLTGLKKCMKFHEYPSSESPAVACGQAKRHDDVAVACSNCFVQPSKTVREWCSWK